MKTEESRFVQVIKFVFLMGVVVPIVGCGLYTVITFAAIASQDLSDAALASIRLVVIAGLIQIAYWWMAFHIDTVETEPLGL